MAGTSSSTEYTSFLSSLEPITIALTQCAFRVDRANYLQSKTDEYRARFRAKLLGFHADHFDVQCQLFLTVTTAERARPLVRFIATYDLHFHGTDVTEANVDKFIDSDVRLIIWPYFRELVNNASGRMHVPPIVLPIGNRGGKSRSKPASKRVLPKNKD